MREEIRKPGKGGCGWKQEFSVYTFLYCFDF